MSSPFEKVAGAADSEAKLAADNWRQRRIDTIRFHGSALMMVHEAVGRIGSVVLDGRISTDIINANTTAIDTTNPSTDIARADVGILPTGVYRRWSGRGVFTPDAALSVSVIFDDRYEYPGQGRRPRPLGQIALTIYARSWGKLSAEEEAAITKVSGALSEYGDNGFDRCGTRAVIRREAGQKLDQEEVETVLAPLAGHVLRYFDIMGLEDPGDKQPRGNFSDRARRNDTTVVVDTQTSDTELRTMRSLPSGGFEHTD